jgi:hypothetical protein
MKIITTKPIVYALCGTLPPGEYDVVRTTAVGYSIEVPVDGEHLTWTHREDGIANLSVPYYAGKVSA